MRNLFRLIAAFLILSAASFAQTPQIANTNPQPLQGINGKWVQGIGIGYQPFCANSACTGLTFDIGVGTCFDSGGGRHVTASTTVLTLSASNTNYIYLTGSACTLSQSTVGYASSSIPIASVVCGSSNCSTFTDDRTLFRGSNGGGGGSANALIYPDYCVGDTSGNVGKSMLALTNIRYWPWTFLSAAGFGGTDVVVYCAFKIPHVLPSGGAKVLVELSANDSTSGHTMTFKECDIIESTTVNVGSPTCTATQNFTTTTTAYAPSVLIFSIASGTPAVDNIVDVIIHATAQSGLSGVSNVYMRMPKLEYE